MHAVLASHMRHTPVVSCAQMSAGQREVLKVVRAEAQRSVKAAADAAAAKAAEAVARKAAEDRRRETAEAHKALTAVSTGSSLPFQGNLCNALLQVCV